MTRLVVSFVACLLLAAGAHAAELGSYGLLAEVWRTASGAFVANLNIGSPPQSTLLLLDISQNYIWVQCSASGGAFAPLHSTTFRPVTRHGASVFVDLPGAMRAQMVTDSFAFNLTDGINPGLEDVEVEKVKFFCSSSSSSSSSSTGVVGMGRGKLSLPSAIASHRNLPRRFTYCLSGAMQAPTPLFLSWSGNYTMMPSRLLSNLQHTPLLKATKKKPGYRLGLQAITLGETTLKINPKVFRGGLEVSTTEPYTKLVRPAYQALRDAFRKAESGIPRVPAHAPFDTCFNSSGLGSTRVGPPVNTIAFVFGNGTFWPFFGDSSMVVVNEDVLCLGFLDAGPLPAHSILGTYQQQDSLVEFDLDRNQFGFYSTLPFISTTCANFNFTRSDI